MPSLVAYTDVRPEGLEDQIHFAAKKSAGGDEVYEPLTRQYDLWQSFVQQVRYHVTNKR